MTKIHRRSIQKKDLNDLGNHNGVITHCQREELHPWQRSWGRRLWRTQRRDQASGDPLYLRIYPQNQSAYFTVLCSHLYLWLYGGLFPTGSLGEGVNSQLQSIKIPGRDKGVSGQTSLLVDELVWQDYPHSCHYAHDCLQPLNHKQHRELGVFWKS